MNGEAMDLYGQSLLDFINGDSSARAVFHRDDGVTYEVSTGVFFRKPEDFSSLEQTAISLCEGFVLDIGAGAGSHSLALQSRGLRVMAIDVSQHAIEVMSKRGVMACQHADVFEFQKGDFDTLLLMHSIGIVENLSGLDRFLRHACKLLKPAGQMVFDSYDVRYTEDHKDLAYQEANKQAGRYFGEVRRRFEYRGQTGPFFSWLHVDPETLLAHAEKAGWLCQLVSQEDDGTYLARLTKAG